MPDQATHTTAPIIETALRHNALVLKPSQPIEIVLLMADADVALYTLHLAAVAVELVPALEARAEELGLHHPFFIG